MTTAAVPSTKATEGRDSTGKFVKGLYKGGPGNPHASKVAELRAAFFEAITRKDIADVLQALLLEARMGNVHACKEVLDRALGQAEAMDLVERLAQLEGLLRSAESGPIAGTVKAA